MRWPALVIAAFLLAPATASAQRVEDTFFNSIIPSRVDHLIGFTPTTFAMYPRGQRVVPITVRVGGRRYRYIFGNAAAAVGPSANIYMRNMIRGRRFPSPQGIFLDRRLKAAERRHVRGARGPRPRRRRPGGGTRASRLCLGGVPCGRPRNRRGDDPYVVGRRRSNPGERGRDRAAPRRRRGRPLRGATLPSGHPPAPRGTGFVQRRPVRGRIGRPRNRGGDELVTSPCLPGRRRARSRSAARRQATHPCARCRTRTPTRSRS